MGVTLFAQRERPGIAHQNWHSVTKNFGIRAVLIEGMFAQNSIHTFSRIFV